MIIHFSCCIILSLPLQDVIFQWLTTNDIQLNNIDAEDPEVLHSSLNLDIFSNFHRFLIKIIIKETNWAASCFSEPLFLMVHQNV